MKKNRMLMRFHRDEKVDTFDSTNEWNNYVGMVCDMTDISQAITYIEHNNIGLLTSYNAHRVVSSYVPFIVSQKQEKKHPLSLFGILKRKNKQWISLQYNELILIIFGADTFLNKDCESAFLSLQVYGKVRLIDDNELFEIGHLIGRQHDINCLPDLETECVGFEFTAHEIYGILNPPCDSFSREFLKKNWFDFAVKRMI